MVALAFVNTLEFYVVAFAVAAAIVALVFRPREPELRERTLFSRGEIAPSAAETPSLALTADSHGRLRLVHRGAEVESAYCQINCAIHLSGGKVRVVERRSAVRIGVPQTIDISYALAPMPNGRYQLVFESEWSSRWAAGSFTLPLQRPLELPVHT